ncbi:MAG TPA: DUF6128 domain-containing protein [Lachnospiraceae bacterium]|nr:DUF6128 domain-containing protein [Lachnospiraceae bacterium]
MIKEDKGFYDKRVVYLDYLERGKKVKNGGFYKWEVKGDTCRVMIHVRGLYPTDTIQGEILIVSQGISYPADHITLHLGSGEYLAVWNANSLAGTEVGVDKCDGLQIRLSENRLLKGLWRESQEAPVMKEEPVTHENPIMEEEPVAQEITIVKEEVSAQEMPVMKEEPLVQKKTEKIEELVEQDIPMLKDDPALTDEKGQLKETREAPVVEKPLSLCSDKWQQLKTQFIIITPFQDGREYLSITPRDFTVLPGKYQTLVQNSFLLHGYYNYGHVVLAREKDRLEEKYYLGVPGVYYDREKQAALMFGFEGFEGGNTKSKDGGFGYYMKRVEI